MTDQSTPPPPQQHPGGQVPPPGYGGPVPPQQPGGPVPPSGFGAAPPPQQAKAPSKAGGILKRIIGAVVVFAVLGLGGLAWRMFTGDPSTANVGDCMVGQSANDLETIECTDATAEWKVAGKVENKSEAEGSNADEVCAAFPTSTVAYWWGKSGGNGDVLCLEPVTK